MLDIDTYSLIEALDIEIISEDESEIQCRCPDWDGHHSHGDRTGKLYINPDKGVYNCWVAGGGNLTQLVSNVRSINYDGAKRFVSNFVDLSLSREVFGYQLDRIFDSKWTEDGKMPYFVQTVLDQWSIESHPWFTQRNISKDVIRRYKLGYNTKDDTIILPHFFENRLVGFQHRYLDDRRPKYKFTLGFPKDRTLWGYDTAKTTPIIVESVPSALMLISHGYDALATFGASVTAKQCRLLRKYSNGIILSRDNDEAGIRWFNKIVSELDAFLPIQTLDVIEGKKADIGDYRGNLDDFISNRQLVLDIIH